MPRGTKLRNDERASNQYELLKSAIFTTNLAEIKRWYGWLTFNADVEGRLIHLAIGLPEKDGDEWLNILPLPLKDSSAFVSKDDEPSPPGPDQLVRFREDVRKMLEAPANDEEAGDRGPRGA